MATKRGAPVLALTLGLALAASWSVAAPTPTGGIRQVEGKAFATADGHLMYRESHWLYEEAGEASRVVLYRCPDGKPFARKLLHAAGSPQAPDFELDDGRTGYREGVRHSHGRRVVFVRKSADAVEKSAPLQASPLPVIDAGFDAYIRSHWDSLGQGDDDTVPFLLPSRLGTLKFKVRRMPDGSVGGRAAHLYRLSLASWIGFALPHIDVAYDAGTRELLRFVGIANIRSDGGDNVRARIEFDPSQDRQASRDELDAALKASLDGRCPIP